MIILLLLSIKLLVSFEKLVFLKIFRLLVNFRFKLRSLNKDILYSLLTKLEFLFGDCSDFFLIGITIRHFLWQRGIFSHHDLYIFFFLHLNQFSSLVSQIFMHSSLNLLLVEIGLFLESTETLFLFLTFPLPLLTGLSLLNY